MHEKDEAVDKSGMAVSTRTMEIVVAAVLLVIAALVMRDAIRVGAGWAEVEGPRAGYFPFYIGAIMGIASLVTLGRAVWASMQERRGGGGSGDAKVFVTRLALQRVLLVLGPMAVYVVAVSLFGIYVSSAAYVALFMMYFGRYRLPSAILMGVCVAVALFMMFEVWFLVPLPKGPLETFLGY
jgi:putative tricarboxylic transport membrane protein